MNASMMQILLKLEICSLKIKENGNSCNTHLLLLSWNFCVYQLDMLYKTIEMVCKTREEEEENTITFRLKCIVIA